MSKLIEHIKKLGQSDEAVVGFAASARAKREPTILLIGQTTIYGLESLDDTPVDAILVKGDIGQLDSVASTLEEKIWGVLPKTLNAAQAVLLKKQGADFVVFDGDSTDATVLDVEDLATVLIVNRSLDDEQARGLRSLSIDAMLYVPNDQIGDLSVARLSQIQAARSGIRKPTIVAIPDTLGAKEIETLRNAGIVGLLVDLGSNDKVRELREAVDNLPRKKRPSDETSSPLVPFGGSHSTTGPEDPDDDDFDEDDY